MKNRNQFKEDLDFMYLWDEDTKIDHIRELHKHIQEMYDELDEAESSALKENHLERIADSLGEISQSLKYINQNSDSMGATLYAISGDLGNIASR